MRTPLTDDEAYKWWREALQTKRQPRYLNEPQAGWYKRRVASRGPFVAARIWWEQEVDDCGELLSEPVLRCIVNGQPKDPFDQWIWLWPITVADYDLLSTNPF